MNQKAYTLELIQIIGSVPADSRNSFLTAFQASEKNPVVLFGFNVWLGWLGIDRFLVGDVVAGIFKLLTFGGFGLWQLIDCFLIGGRARDKNIQLARQMAQSYTRPAAAAAPAVAADEAAPEGAA